MKSKRATKERGPYLLHRNRDENQHSGNPKH